MAVLEGPGPPGQTSLPSLVRSWDLLQGFSQPKNEVLWLQGGVGWGQAREGGLGELSPPPPRFGHL